MKKLRSTRDFIFAVFCVFLLMAGCSTTNHAPLPAFCYQDITGHYNAYFNANEKMKGIYAAMDKAHKDNYKEVIPIYTYSDPKEAKAVTADCDDIIKRLTLSVQIHKTSNWADDDFVMMGRANYIKGNYEKAVAFFKYTTTEYKNGVDYVKEMKKMGKIAKPTLKKKPPVKPHFEQVKDENGNMVLNKIDERPSKSFMIHSPARSEALIWLAKTFSSQKKYAEASSVIQLMRHDDKFYSDYDKDVELTDAENYLNQKNYNDAIKPLERFLTMTKKKKERIRPVFILAQIYEKTGNYAKASEYYKQVLSNNPSYEMEFYAKIKRAKLGSKSGSNAEIKKLLIAMSRDGKYKEYYDQVYYQLGEIALSENDRADARKDFHKSIKASLKNADQKALSYLRLGQMDYEEEYYVTAKFFYDSTVKNMSKSDSAFESVDARDKTLAKLVKQIDIITTEDSLQRIANMSPADMERFLKKLLEDKEKAAEANKNGGKSPNINPDFLKAPGTGTGAANEEASAFYFYNTGARSSGYADFAKKWGDRKLEDNWRRKDKSVSQTDVTEDTTKKVKDTTSVPTGSEEEKLMAGLPMTPEKMEKSNGKLIDAFYALGIVYKDDLQSYRKALLAFEELNKRFPKNKLELESFYQLYLLHDRLKNSEKANYYKEQILEKYPTSAIAKYLKDPAYLAEVKDKENALTNYYSSAFYDYSSGMYASAEKKCADVDKQFKENKMRAKFDLLNAMSLAKENRLGDYVEALNKIINKYPNTPEKDQAQKWLTIVNHSKLPQVDISKLPKDTSGYAAAVKAVTPVVNGVANMDTAGRANFLAKTELQRKARAKEQADLKAMADARAAVEGKTAKDSAQGKVLTKTERIDSAMNAEKSGNNQTVANPAKTGRDTTAKKAAPSGARPAFDTDTLTHVFDTIPNAPHYVIFYFLDPAAHNSALVSKIEDFNGDNFSTDKLTAKSTLIDKDNKMVVVKSFKNKDAALAYIRTLTDKLGDIMKNIKPDQYFLGAINSLNYSTLVGNRKINNYMRFYRAYYK